MQAFYHHLPVGGSSGNTQIVSTSHGNDGTPNLRLKRYFYWCWNLYCNCLPNLGVQFGEFVFSTKGNPKILSCNSVGSLYYRHFCLWLWKHKGPLIIRKLRLTEIVIAVPISTIPAVRGGTHFQSCREIWFPTVVKLTNYTREFQCWKGLETSHK